MPSIKLKSEYPDLRKYEDEFENIWYYKNNTNIMHNPYGPAFISKHGYKEYWIENKLHRLDGPAKILNNGLYKEYYINNLFIADNQKDFFTNLKDLKTNTINSQHKSIILNIKNSLSHNLDPSSLNILKSLV